MYLGYKDENCMIHFLIMQQTYRGLLTAIASDDLFKAMAVSRPLSAYSLLRKKFKHFYSMYLGKGSQQT